VDIDREDTEVQSLLATGAGTMQFLSPLNLMMWDWRYPADKMNQFLATERWRSLGEYQDGMVFVQRLKPADMMEMHMGLYVVVVEAVEVVVVVASSSSCSSSSSRRI
jgi:hypothetical protein